MIWINASLQKFCIEGHANTAPHGSDLVCSAVSSIICAAIEIWSSNKQIKITQTNSGYVLIDWNNIDWDQQLTLKNQYFFCLQQLEILVKYHPNYIKINTIDFIH